MNKEKVVRALTNDTEVDKAHTNKVDTALTIRLKLIQPRLGKVSFKFNVFKA